MKMRVYLKGGGNFAIEVTEFTVTRNPITEEISSLEWKYPQKHKSRLSYMNLREVAAVIRED